MTGKIICVSEAKGAVHDFELFKQSSVHIANNILLIADKGYQGIAKIHMNSLIPFKKPRNVDLTYEQKRFNGELSRFRILIEHVNRLIKRFKIFSYRYRNKQRKHLMRMSLICGVYNFDRWF
jgi:hypothetical protein